MSTCCGSSPPRIRAPGPDPGSSPGGQGGACYKEWTGVATKGNKKGGWRTRTTCLLRMPTTNQGRGRDVHETQSWRGSTDTGPPQAWLCFPGPWPCQWRKGAVKEGCTPGEDSHVTRMLWHIVFFEAYAPASKKEIIVSFVGAEPPKYPTKDQKRRGRHKDLSPTFLRAKQSITTGLFSWQEAHTHL